MKRGTVSSRLSLADALFGGIQQRVLGLLFGQPERSFYASEIIARVNGGSGAVQRELARLAQSELVTVEIVGNQKHYQANPASPIHSELCAIARKTVGMAEPLRAALAPQADQIRAAFVYGSVAKRQDTASSDIDLMVIADELTYGELFSNLDALSDRLGRVVNPTICTPEDLRQRVGQGEAFITRVLQQPKIWLIGGEHELGL
ncbi:transcriptional regulator [Rhizobacter sp. Root16D2]|nr:transcriptional regulator [Rhizobacter sp. Root29]KQV97499.1 transcriptional regulator [Rhizobacter sp. Root1238]KRB10172.1 transcriptional regulator [Rhizobacter sp. Root16D2]